MVDVLTDRAGPCAMRAASTRAVPRPVARASGGARAFVAPDRQPEFREPWRPTMSDDDTEAFLRDVRRALAAAPRPADPSLEVLQRIATWLRTPVAEEPEANEPRRDDSGPAPG